MTPRPARRDLNRQGSLYLSETAFFDAAIHATHSTGDHANNDPNALHDTDKMVKIATTFLERACPEYLDMLMTLKENEGDNNYNSNSVSDRLVKVGRNVSSTLRFERRRSSLQLLVQNDNKEEVSTKQESPSMTNGMLPLNKAKMDASLALLADECRTMTNILNQSETRRVPKVRYGRTELQMPIVTLGGMRFQQSWNNREDQPAVVSMEQVEKECQANVVETLQYAIRMGINHIETAKGYGCSELQLGDAFQHLFESGFCKREDLIIQTKGGVSSSMTKDEYRQQFLSQLELLQLDYVDLFSVHGINTPQHLEWLFGEANLYQALVELKREGKIKHIGFSTHAEGSIIEKTIKTNKFDYVNLHYHFCGSYTSSGDCKYGGNLSNVQLAQELDMGVFIISPYDKGGRVYAPSNKLRELTLPEMEPMTYSSHFLWNHDKVVAMDEENKTGPPIHTIVCGAGRASDLDQPIVAALSLMSDPEEILRKTCAVHERLQHALEDAIGKDFAKAWHVGLPNWSLSNYGTQLNNIVWMHNIIKAYGLLDFCKERYAPIEGYLKTWDLDKSKQENAQAMGPGFAWVPGCAYKPEYDYTVDVQQCPQENQEKILQALAFVHKWCGTKENDQEKENASVPTPLEWETSYDMRPWTAFPER